MMAENEQTTHEIHMNDIAANLLNSKKSSLISDSKFDRVVAYLSDPDSKIDANLKHWIKQERQFTLQDVPALGLKGVLACPVRQKKEVGFVFLAALFTHLSYVSSITNSTVASHDVKGVHGLLV